MEGSRLFFNSSVIKGFIETSGAKMYYETAGKGFPLVFLHAGGLDLRMWNNQIDYFSSSYRVVCYDVPGCGRSTAPTEPFTDAEVLRTLLKHLGIEKACLIGESLGGRIAIDFTLEYQEMVKGLILSGPGLGGYEWSKEYTEQIEKIFSYAEKGDALAATEEWLKHPHLIPAMRNPSLRDWVRQMNLDNAKLWVQGLPERPLQPPAIKRLREVSVPTQIIVGELDVPDIYSICDLLMGSIAGARKTVIQGAGHLVSMEKPDEFNEIMFQFLNKLL
ncbi:MAG: alpha/beta hydrolase [Anaerolineales bacterium]|nr:alpha/beta hydrolase [Anaerolineales bacterium]